MVAVRASGSLAPSATSPSYAPSLLSEAPSDPSAGGGQLFNRAGGTGLATALSDFGGPVTSSALIVSREPEPLIICWRT